MEIIATIKWRHIVWTLVDRGRIPNRVLRRNYILVCHLIDIFSDRKGSVCFRHGMSCLPKWFLDHVGVDVSYAVDTKYVTDLVSSELTVTAFGYEPPVPN